MSKMTISQARKSVIRAAKALVKGYTLHRSICLLIAVERLVKLEKK